MAAVGTVVITDRQFSGKPNRPLRKLSLAWKSDASGNVSGTLTGYVAGQLVRAVFQPAASPNAPTDSYAAVLLDEQGMDVLAGEGGALSATVASHCAPAVPSTDGTTTGIAPMEVEDKLELQVSGAGSGKMGTVTLYIR